MLTAVGSFARTWTAARAGQETWRLHDENHVPGRHAIESESSDAVAHRREVRTVHHHHCIRDGSATLARHDRSSDCSRALRFETRFEFASAKHPGQQTDARQVTGPTAHVVHTPFHHQPQNFVPRGPPPPRAASLTLRILFRAIFRLVVASQLGDASGRPKPRHLKSF